MRRANTRKIYPVVSVPGCQGGRPTLLTGWACILQCPHHTACLWHPRSISSMRSPVGICPKPSSCSTPPVRKLFRAPRRVTASLRAHSSNVQCLCNATDSSMRSPVGISPNPGSSLSPRLLHARIRKPAGLPRTCRGRTEYARHTCSVVVELQIVVAMRSPVGIAKCHPSSLFSRAGPESPRVVDTVPRVRRSGATNMSDA